MRRTCDCGCGVEYEAKTKRSRFATTACRVRASRRAGCPTLTVVPQIGDSAPMPAESAPVKTPSSTQDMTIAVATGAVAAGVLTATHKELVDAGVLDTAMGQTAMQLAAQLQYVPQGGAAMAALSRELRQVLDAALAGAKGGGDRLDEIGKRRHAKWQAAST